MSEITIADLYLAGLLSLVYQICLDTGFQKAMSHVTDWYLKVTKL